MKDPDTYWHVMTGRWIIAHGDVPRVDDRAGVAEDCVAYVRLK
jgi:hypothetical protein